MSVTKKQIERCVSIARQYGTKKLVLFGSALVNPTNANDIDFLCEGIDGWRIYEMAARMENECGIAVDITPIDSETPFVEYNLKEGRELLAA